MTYILKITFDTMEELSLFIQDKKNKEGDKRGLNVSVLHQNAKAYQLEHTDTPYRVCLKLGNCKKEIDLNEIKN